MNPWPNRNRQSSSQVASALKRGQPPPRTPGRTIGGVDAVAHQGSVKQASPAFGPPAACWLTSQPVVNSSPLIDAFVWCSVDVPIAAWTSMPVHSPQVRNMQQFRRFPLCRFTAAVVAGCRLNVGMARQLLCRRNIRAGVEQVRDKRPPKIVRRKRRYARLDCALFQNVEHSLVGQAVDRDSAALINVAEQRAGITTTSNKPVFQGIGGTVGGISKAIFTTLRPADRQFAGLDVVVAQVQTDTLGTPQPGSVQNSD